MSHSTQSDLIGGILVVCHGNICRSPMAEALLRNALEQRGRATQIHSAGIGAVIGAPPDPHALELMRARGLDISAHRARQITGNLAAEHDLVFTMEIAQTRWLCERYPALYGRVFRLGHWGGQDIPDPYRGPRTAFEEALRQIDMGINEWIKKLS